MKKTSTIMGYSFTTKAFYFTISFIFILLITSYGQVPTVVLNGDAIEKFIPFYNSEFISPTTLPDVNIQKELATEAQEKNGLHRFGVKVPTNITNSDGEIQEYGHYIIWRKSFYAKYAKSLNFEFENLNLPLNTQMYIYNRVGTMLSGPIDHNHVFEGKYSTDIIQGSEVSIEVIIPKSEFNSFKIKVSKAICGFRDIDNINFAHGITRDYGDSDDCEVDVKCSPYGSGWTDERDAVCLLINGEYLGSGALINTSCQELNGFLLTAYHLLNGASGHLDFTFRFNYDSPNPNSLTNNCRGIAPMSWLTYSGAELRASWSTTYTDFALLQLDGSVIGQPTLALAGWDRSDYTPDAACGIHHPKADVKKISFDYEPLVIEASGGGTGTQYLRVQWDVGVTEIGSSGSPLFDLDSHKIVGQLSGGTSYCTAPNDPDWYGRVFSSWTGGGTSSSRLSDWLGSGTTTNTIRSPYISSISTGPLCTTNVSYVLNNLIPGRSATWAVTPTGLFATTSGAGTSGSGTTAVLRAASGASGLAVLTFTISAGTGCSTIPVSKPIWVGKPGSGLEIDDYLCFTEEGIASILLPDGADNGLMGVSSTVWTYSGPISYFSSGPAIAHYSGTTSGHGYINLTITNACGHEDFHLPYQIVDCERSAEIVTQVYPNPTNGTLFVITSQKKDEFSNKHLQAETGKIYLYNKLGHIVMQENLTSASQEINTSLLPPDIYVLEVQYGDVSTRTKVIIIK